MKLRKSFSQSLPKTSGNHFFLLCGGKTLNREIGRKSWCHNGARDRKIVEVEKKMGFQNFTFHFYQKDFLEKFPLAPNSTRVKTQARRRRRRLRMEKHNFRTFITSLAALWMNFDDVVARAADGQPSALLMRSYAFRQIPPMSLAV